LGFRPPPSLLKYGDARGDTKALPYPRFDPPPPSGRGGTRLRRAGQASGEHDMGQMGKIPIPAGTNPRARAQRLGVRAGRAGGRPIRNTRGGVAR
jgi:hypothetical protein